MNKDLKKRFWSGIVFTLLVAMLGTLLAPVALSQESSSPAASPESSAPAHPAYWLNRDLKNFGDDEGYTLKTVRTERQYPFTRPAHWKVLPSSHINVFFQHSPNLLPERSNLNVLVNNRLLKTISLEKNNVAATKLQIAIPPELIKDKNLLTFQVDQHYTYKCEDPFSSELWTTLLPETSLHLAYDLMPIHPHLGKFPYPMVDPLDVNPTVLGYVLPSKTASDESLTALSIIATGFGQQVSWRAIEPFLATPAQWNSNNHLVLIGTPEENEAFSQLASSFTVPLQNGKWVDPKTHQALEPTVGVLQYIPHPQFPSKAVLIVSGNGPTGVQQAAKALFQKPANKLLAGSYAIIKNFEAGPQHPYREWDGFVRTSGETLGDLGLDTLTTRGITGLPLLYPLNFMPDLFLPWQQKVKLKTVYSYSSQTDGSQSKLEVLLNGKSLKNVPLDDRNGKNLAEMTLEVPTEEVHTYNNLEYRFHLYPEKYDMCRFVTDVHLWGTVHKTSTVEFPGDVRTPLPDLGLLNDGGFPLTAYQDLSQMTVVLPKTPEWDDVNLMVQILTRLGRISQSHSGLNVTAHHVNTLPDAEKKGNHLLAIQSYQPNDLFKELQSKLNLLISGRVASLKDSDKKLMDLHFTPNHGVLEEMLSPWNGERVVLLAYGQTAPALESLGSLFSKDSWFGQIQPGNILVVDDKGPRSLMVLKKGEARFLLHSDLKSGWNIPEWGWIIVAFFAVLGLLSTLRFLFGR